ncbi:unnamed protein product [Rangifer tarandus platyrhynchus]|uniref:Uncharacterized protein n=1 Tax=Rangifer tarandus platyrhynchus TaxID=3082113 RepID=A0AC59YJM3_RANTA
METNWLRRPWGPRARKGPRPLSSLSRQAPVFRMEWSPVPGTGGNAALWRRFTPAVPGFPSAANSGWRFDACASGKVGNHHPQGSKKELFDLLFPQPGPREACGTLKLGGGRRGGKVQEALDPEDFCSPSPSLFTVPLSVQRQPTWTWSLLYRPPVPPARHPPPCPPG